MSNDSLTATRQTWVAVGPAGAVGSIHRVDGGFTFTLFKDSAPRPVYPTLQVVKRALYASLLPGSDWPEFHEH